MGKNVHKALITGGARSGKSGFAERYAAALGKQGIYIATAQALDEEMQERLALHRLQRDRSGFPWETVEEPLQLAETLERLGSGLAPNETVILVDCLTLWLSNVILQAESSATEAIRFETDKLAAAVRRFPGKLLLVTNEVGDGVVPVYPLGRLFRDQAGLLNRRLASLCDEVFLVTAGIPVELKRLAFRMDGVWPVPQEQELPGMDTGSATEGEQG